MSDVNYTYSGRLVVFSISQVYREYYSLPPTKKCTMKNVDATLSCRLSLIHLPQTLLLCVMSYAQKQSFINDSIFNILTVLIMALHFKKCIDDFIPSILSGLSGKNAKNNDSLQSTNYKTSNYRHNKLQWFLPL